jgi:DNA polymerase-3 subunit delta'
MPDAPLEGLRSIRGQAHVTGLLLRAIENRRVASAYLFEGPAGVGKERTARALAQTTVCTQPRPDHDACGTCPPCRHVANRTHVDVLTLARTIDVLSQSEHRPSDVKTEIVVEKVRVLQSERLAFHAHEGERWVIVRDAHEMNASASNALLKTLEEPPANTHFALVTSQPTLLLPTIRSRCQRVRFAPLAESDVAAILEAQGTEHDAALAAARYADGSVTAGLEFADDERRNARAQWVERTLNALRSGKPAGYVDLAESLKDVGKNDADEVSAILSMIERHFRDDAIRYASEPGRRAAVCAARAYLVRETFESLDKNLNVQMAMELMLARLRDLRA